MPMSLVYAGVISPVYNKFGRVNMDAFGSSDKKRPLCFADRIQMKNITNKYRISAVSGSYVIRHNT